MLAAHDLVDGRSLSSMVTAPAAGAYLRDEVRYSDDGAAAFASGVMRIEAGESERSIVAAWGRSSEHDFEELSRNLFDRIDLAPLGLSEHHVSALNAQKWRIMGGDDSSLGKARSRREQAAASNPRALGKGEGCRSDPSYPLGSEDMPRWADVVAAVVISGKPSSVRVKGMGLSSEPYWPGERGIAQAPALRSAAGQAMAEAGIDAGSIDIFEIDGLTLYDEALGMEAVGLAEAGQGLNVLASDARCNPSGGGAAGYCAPAMGLARLVEAVSQLQGRAGPVQQGSPKLALASGSGVVAGQTQTAIVLEAV